LLKHWTWNIKKITRELNFLSNNTPLLYIQVTLKQALFNYDGE